MKFDKTHRSCEFTKFLIITMLVLLMLISIGSAASVAKVSNQSDNAFPYPRGTVPAYGYMRCVDYTFFSADGKIINTTGSEIPKDAVTSIPSPDIPKGATLIHIEYVNSTTPQDIVNDTKLAKKLGVGKYLLLSGGPEMSTDSFWKAVKNKGVKDSDFFGVYFPDEPQDPSKIISMYKSMKKYFPRAVAGDYLGGKSAYSYNRASKFLPGLDVCFFTSYSIIYNLPHATPYGNLIANAPIWKKAGKTVYLTTEAFGDACKVNTSNPDLNTAKKVSDRQTSQIVMGILGGAQGVFSFKYREAKGTPCDKGWASFMPKYKQIWPWIMKGDRKILPTKVTSGVKSITISPGGKINAVTAYIFTDGKGRKLVASSSMLDFTEAKGMANKAIITGVPNGKYKVLWENRTVTVTNKTIKDTWQPYGYHFYQLM